MNFPGMNAEAHGTNPPPGELSGEGPSLAFGMAMELFETHEVTKGTRLQLDFCDKKKI